MNNKRICILRSNPVNPDSRVEKEALSLVNAGFEVCVFAWDRSANYSYQNSDVCVAGVNIPIVRIGCKASFGEGFKNLKPYLLFQYRMRQWLKKNINTINCIHACDFDTAYFSFSIAKKYKKKFVFDIFDFLYGDAKTFFQRKVKNAQIHLINKADATIICTEERRKQIVGANPKRLIVVHNSPFLAQTSDKKIISSLTQKIKIVYVGILQDYRLLIELGQFFNVNKCWELHIGGFGKYEQYFSKLAKQCENVFFYGKLSYDQTLALERDCDIMLGIYDPKIENHRFAAPNKFYEALMLNKPIIMVNGTGMSEIVKSNCFGVTIDYNLESFADGLKKLENILKNGQKKDSREFFEKQYSWDIMKDRLVMLYNDLCCD